MFIPLLLLLKCCLGVEELLYQTFILDLFICCPAWSRTKVALVFFVVGVSDVLAALLAVVRDHGGRHDCFFDAERRCEKGWRYALELALIGSLVR